MTKEPEMNDKKEISRELLDQLIADYKKGPVANLLATTAAQRSISLAQY